MRFEPSDDQAMIAETFGRFLDENSSMARVRAAPAGFDAALWRGLAELGGLGIRVPEADGGVGLGVLDAVLVMEQAGANIADYVLMLTRTDPDAPKHKGLTMFIVPLKAEGVEIQPVYTFQDERTNITYYDGVRIPDSYRLGDVGGGVKVMSASLEMEHGASWIKTQRHMLHEAETFCRETRRHADS